MNFDALQGLINSILSEFKCNQCGSKVDKKDVNIKAIDGSMATIELTCRKCGLKSFIKSEVVSLDLAKHLTKQQVETLKNSLLKGKLEKNISDEEIVKLGKDLKKENFNASDLFNKN